MRPARAALPVALALAASIVGAANALAGTPAGDEADETVWLCMPGEEPNPCRESLETTIYEPDGRSRVEAPENSAKPKIDCFYVYPTVSEDPGTNSDRSIDPEEVAIARYQASRFSHRCRVFAPMYRQRTLASIASGSAEQQAAALRLAYSDVRAAWRDYLANHSRGRGFVLIGHSQGTVMLRELIRDVIDRRKRARRRLVAAILLGGNVTVRKGELADGDFAKVPGCESRRQLGCVIAYSVFDETPPENSRFGRPTGGSPNAFDFPSGEEYEILCTNPAALDGGRTPLETLLRSEPYPGIIGLLLLQTYGGSPPSAPTPWLQPADRYEGECAKEDGASFLRLTPIGSARRLNPAPDEGWGLHLTDVNIALGDLVELVRKKKRAYVRSLPRG